MESLTEDDDDNGTFDGRTDRIRRRMGRNERAEDNGGTDDGRREGRMTTTEDNDVWTDDGRTDIR